MAHPQSSPRGLFSKNRIDIGANQLTANSTALILSGGVKVSNKQTLTANTTGLVAPDAAMSALPGAVRQSNAHIGIGTNSTGRFLAINTTGTTWLFISGTTVQPTT